MDLLNPKWKGQILTIPLSSGEYYVPPFNSIREKYGDDFFVRLRAQNLRVYNSMAPLVQALAAGEGAIVIPMVGAFAQQFKKKGAPVDMVGFEYTSGVEWQVLLTARGKGRHPNAARLMANYVMSVEGNAVYNADPGATTIYDSARLPKEYQPFRPATAA